MSAPIARFGPDAPLAQLPDAMRACLPPAPPSRGCDEIMGSAFGGLGYCSVEPYRSMSFCACANSSVPCPMIAAAACANSGFAYLPSPMQPPDGAKYAACRGQPICVNLVQIGGAQNVASGITQQCGTIQNVRNVVSANPALAGLAFVLVLALLLLLLTPTDPEPGEGAPGPPGPSEKQGRLPPKGPQPSGGLSDPKAPSGQ